MWFALVSFDCVIVCSERIAVAEEFEKETSVDIKQTCNQSARVRVACWDKVERDIHSPVAHVSHAVAVWIQVHGRTFLWGAMETIKSKNLEALRR